MSKVTPDSEVIKSWHVEDLLVEEELFCACGHSIKPDEDISTMPYCVRCKAAEYGMKTGTGVVITRGIDGGITDVREVWVH